MSPGSEVLGRLSDTDSEEGNTMIFNAPPTLMRVITQPADSPNLAPNELAGWWMAGRAEPTQPADSANLEADSLGVRAARPRWPGLRRTGRSRDRRYAKGYTVAV